MPITANCSGCGKTIAAPDSAAGRKARCPHCNAIVDIPGGAANVAVAVATPPVAEPALTPPSSVLRPPTPRLNGSLSSSRTSATTIDRMLARTSPYKSLRLMAAIVFGAGAVLAALIGVGGLVGLILVSLSGSPLVGIGVFVGAIAVAAGIFLGAKILSELLGLWADMGDRTRQMAQLLEDSLARRDNGI